MHDVKFPQGTTTVNKLRNVYIANNSGAFTLMLHVDFQYVHI